MSDYIETTREKSTSNLKFSVGIKNPPDFVNSGDEIEGVLHIQNVHNKKDQKLKDIVINFWEEYDQWVESADGTKEYKSDRSHKKGIKIEPPKKKLKSGEQIDVPFQVRIAGGMHLNMGNQNPSKNWSVGMMVGVKSKLVKSYQYNRILPFQQSDISATWLD
jgi:hypothetical protein